MAMHVQRHANVSKQATLLDGLEVSPLKWRVWGCGLNRFVHEPHLKCKGSFKDLQWKCKYCAFDTHIPIYLGDNCIQIFHLGRYIVGYTVGN